MGKPVSCFVGEGRSITYAGIPTKEEAYEVYCMLKDNYARKLADTYENLVDERVITILRNFSVKEYLNS